MFRHFYSVLFYTFSAAASIDVDAGALSPFDPAISCTWIVCTRPRRGQVAWTPEAATAATVKMKTAISDIPTTVAHVHVVPESGPPGLSLSLRVVPELG